MSAKQLTQYVVMAKESGLLGLAVELIASDVAYKEEIAKLDTYLIALAPRATHWGIKAYDASPWILIADELVQEKLEFLGKL